MGNITTSDRAAIARTLAARARPLILEGGSARLTMNARVYAVARLILSATNQGLTDTDAWGAIAADVAAVGLPMSKASVSKYRTAVRVFGGVANDETLARVGIRALYDVGYPAVKNGRDAREVLQALQDGTLTAPEKPEKPETGNRKVTLTAETGALLDAYIAEYGMADADTAIAALLANVLPASVTAAARDALTAAGTTATVTGLMAVTAKARAKAA
jgi:hypothetical protein